MYARELRRKTFNRLFTLACLGATALALSALVFILCSLVIQGVGSLDLQVFTESTPAPGSQGGLLNAIAGSLMMCGLAMIIAIVVGVLAGTWLAEFGGHTRYGMLVRFLNDVLLSAPSILVGLFIYELLVRPFHGFSGYAGAVALAFLATPIVTRTTEDILNLQPHALREAGIALGTPQWRVIRDILWRSATAGLVTGGLLGFARISGETAPLLFTALNNQFFGLNMGHPTASLPVVIFQFALSAYDDWRRLAWVGSLLIAAVVLSISIIGRFMTREKYKP